MTNKFLPLAAAAVATALLGTALATAQAAQSQPTSSAPAGPMAKPSPYPSPSQDPYQGVSAPPADPILTTDEAPSQPPAAVSPAAPVSHPADDAAAETASPSDQGTAPQLTTRPAETPALSPTDPDSEVVTYLPGPANALPEGTVFRVRMSQEIMASDTIPGTPFRAQLSQDLMHDGRVVIPAGSTLLGKIIYTTSGRRIGGGSSIHLRPDEFVLPNGTHYQLHAEAIDTEGSNTKPTGEGNISSKDHGKRTLVEVAAGSGGGALVGAAVAGPTGAIVGTAVGAGLASAHWLLATQSADLPAESTVVFSLTEPMFLTPAGD